MEPDVRADGDRTGATGEHGVGDAAVIKRVAPVDPASSVVRACIAEYGPASLRTARETPAGQPHCTTRWCIGAAVVKRDVPLHLCRRAVLDQVVHQPPPYNRHPGRA
jgi:hypothetical protein